MDFKLLFEKLIKLYPNNKRIWVIVKASLYQEYCKENSIEMHDNDILDKQRVSIDNHEITIMCSKTLNTSYVTVIPFQDDKPIRFKHYRYKDFKLEHDQVISFIDTRANK